MRESSALLAPPSPPALIRGLEPRVVADPDTVRERLIRAIVDLSAVAGLASVSVADVCDRSRIGRRTFYRYFGDVPDLFVVAFGQINDDLRWAVWDRWTAAGQRPTAVVEAIVDFARADWSRANALFVQALAAGDAVALQRLRTLEWLGTLLAVDAPAVDAPDGLARPAFRHEIACGGVWNAVRNRVLADDVAGLTASAPELMRFVDDFGTAGGG